MTPASIMKHSNDCWPSSAYFVVCIGLYAASQHKTTPPENSWESNWVACDNGAAGTSQHARMVVVATGHDVTDRCPRSMTHWLVARCCCCCSKADKAQLAHVGLSLDQSHELNYAVEKYSKLKLATGQTTFMCFLAVRYMSSSVRLSVVCLSVTFVHPTQPTEIFGNVSAPFNTLVTWRHPV